MQTTCIAIVDATRARVFVLTRAREPEGVRDMFTEQTDLVNPARRRTPAELFSDSRTNTSRIGHKQFGVDDHVAAHVDHLDAEFARAVVAAIDKAVQDASATRLVVCAAPRMLGILRTQLGRPGLTIDEVAHDYTKLTPTELRGRLAEQGLLPDEPVRVGLQPR